MSPISVILQVLNNIPRHIYVVIISLSSCNLLFGTFPNKSVGHMSLWGLAIAFIQLFILCLLFKNLV